MTQPERFRLLPVIAACLLLAVSCFTGTGSAQETYLEKEALLAGMESRYANTDFTATFQQRSTLKAIDITEDANGIAYFSHPGKMRWEYTYPQKHQIITNGETLWIHRPEDNQVVISSASDFFKSGAGGAFLSDISKIRSNYAITLENSNPVDSDLILIPEKSDPEITSIRIRVSSLTFEINRITTVNSYGDTTELKFSQIDFKPLDPALFNFKVPEGLDVFYMNQ